MPFTIRYLHTGADVRVSGRLAGEDLTRIVEATARDEYLGGRQYSLVDYSAVDEIAITADDLQRIADRHDLYAGLRRPLLTALVVPQLFGYGHARMWQVFAESLAVRSEVFRSRPEAIAWLAVQNAGDPELED